MAILDKGKALSPPNLYLDTCSMLGAVLRNNAKILAHQTFIFNSGEKHVNTSHSKGDLRKGLSECYSAIAFVFSSGIGYF